jgi:hypothetical protein
MTDVIDTLTTSEQLQSIRKEWEQWQWYPEADPDFVSLIVESRKEAQGVCVLALRESRSVQGLLVGRSETSRLNSWPGLSGWLGPRLRVLEVLYGGMLGDWREENAEKFVLALKAGLARGDWQVIRFRMLDLRSPLWAIAKRHFGWLCRGCVAAPNPHWSLRLPKSFGELQKSLDSKTRKNMKRHLKLLESEVRDISVRRLDQLSDLKTITETSEAIFCKTYQKGLEPSWTSEEMVKRVSLWLRRGSFQSFFLFAGDKACAYQHILKYRGHALAAGTGYDPGFQRYGVGKYIQFRALEDLCRDGDVTVLDFGYGDAEYKREWCNSRQEEADLVLFRLSWAGLLGNAMRTGEIKGFENLKRLLKSSGLFASVKRAWRARRRKNSRNGPSSGAES